MSNRGFTLLEIVISLGILALLVSGTIIVAAVAMDATRQSETLEKVMMFKRAILGDPRIVTKESRTDFGYVGDMGSLPAALQDLWVKGPQGSYVYDNSKKTGAGWAGPYIQVGPLNRVNDLTLDAFGNPIQYVVQTGVSSLTGQEYRAKLSSWGPDQITGTADDIIVEIYATEILSRVSGYIRDTDGDPISGVDVKVNYPVNGALTNTATQTDDFGAYSVLNVPIGSRSIILEPKLAYQSGSAVATGGATANNVQFTIVSFKCGSITSFTATWDYVASFASAKIGSKTATTQTTASGTTVNFSPIDVSGTGCSGSATNNPILIPVRLQSAFSLLGDQDTSGAASPPTAFTIYLNIFKNGNTAVDMAGASFTVVFSDGSKAAFTTSRQ